LVASGIDNGTEVPVWNNCDSLTLACYAVHLDQLLQNITAPFDAVFSNAHDSTDLPHIDRFYADIFSCISNAVSDVVPTRNCSCFEFNVRLVGILT
jgi:hypothetical protein